MAMIERIEASTVVKRLVVLLKPELSTFIFFYNYTLKIQIQGLPWTTLRNLAASHHFVA